MSTVMTIQGMLLEDNRLIRSELLQGIKLGATELDAGNISRKPEDERDVFRSHGILPENRRLQQQGPGIVGIEPVVLIIFVRHRLSVP